MLDLSSFEVLTFDCYGTLIDWETGIWNALRPILAAHAVELPRAEVLALYAELEAAEEVGDFKPYRVVLQNVVAGLGKRLHFTPTASELGALPASVQHWPPFADTVAALMRLHQRYRLAVISNVDDDLFAASARQLQVPFEWVITAQQVGSYKPALNNFQQALARIGVPPQRVLHVAQSLYHDIVPARVLGLATVWVNRRQGQPGSGATPPAVAVPDWEVPDLWTFA